MTIEAGLNRNFHPDQRVLPIVQVGLGHDSRNRGAEECRTVTDGGNGGQVTGGGVPIVDFDDPPVVEVVAGVAFDGLGPEAAPYVAAFWNQHLRERFPRIEQQPAYTPPRETLNDEPPPSQIQFEILAGVPPVRLWVSSVSNEELIQLQPGWFACNWRKTRPGSAYDHWQARREALATWFSAFSEFIASQGAGVPKVTQCEVTYVNHILPNHLWDNHSQADRIFPFMSARTTEGQLERFSTEMEFALSEGGSQFGRLHVKVLPAYAKDGRTPLYVLELTARGPVQAEGIGAESATSFLDKGRSAIVKTFMQLTSEEMQAKAWGKK